MMNTPQQPQQMPEINGSVYTNVFSMLAIVESYFLRNILIKKSGALLQE